MADDIRFYDTAFETERYHWQEKAVLEAAEIGAEIARNLAPVRHGPGPHGPKSAYFGDPAGGLRDSIESSAAVLDTPGGPTADFGTLRRYYRALARWRAAKYLETAAYFREGKPRGVSLYLVRTLEELRGVLAGRWDG